MLENKLRKKLMTNMETNLIQIRLHGKLGLKWEKSLEECSADMEKFGEHLKRSEKLTYFVSLSTYSINKLFV